ncbi:hypothetical protein BXZ70DRAFT_1007907 [Cristinia sonorae]|uniref:Uncharacterized protein n=1 Tax=Cristinia sonorae TaxID=1940300 RepID=A0A8K0UQH6_9AGAR|nr:hypothetical protein BXZ70DRAFT_1007907 [Cristinia sonorae]
MLSKVGPITRHIFQGFFRFTPMPQAPKWMDGPANATATAWLVEATTDPLIPAGSMWTIPLVIWPDVLIKQLPEDLMERFSSATINSYGFLFVSWESRIHTRPSSEVNDGIPGRLLPLTDELRMYLGEDRIARDDREIQLLLRFTLMQWRYLSQPSAVTMRHIELYNSEPAIDMSNGVRPNKHIDYSLRRLHYFLVSDAMCPSWTRQYTLEVGKNWWLSSTV